MLRFVCILGVLWLALLVPASAINISGGGTNTISTAINANAATGADLVITDSLTYTETQDLLIGRRYSVANGRKSINITAASGQTPTIVLSGCRIVMYAGSADVRLGSNSGGRIRINCGATAGQPIWYIGQEDGAPAGPACHALFENLHLDFTGLVECIIFGAGGNDGAPLTTGATMTFNNCTMVGGDIQIRTLYGPASYASTLNVTNSFMYGCTGTEAWNIEANAFGLGGANSVINLSRTIIYNKAGTVAGDPNCLVQRGGIVNMDHCDLYSENGGRGTAIVGGTNNVTNSIIYGAAGLANFAGTGNVTDSNVGGSAVAQAGYTVTNCITEWPVYYAVGEDPFNLDQFAVPASTLSRTHGSSPPLGARGAGSLPVELSDFSMQ